MSPTHNEQNAATLIAQHQQNLSNPEMVDHMRKLQAAVLQDCQHYVKTKRALAIKANNLFWEHFPKERQEYHPYNPLNLQVTVSRIPYYVKCMEQCAERWIGYHFRFPLLWLPGQQYKAHYKLTKKEEVAAWQQLQSVYGFRNRSDNTFFNYCINNLHSSSQYFDSDLE